MNRREFATGVATAALASGGLAPIARAQATDPDSVVDYDDAADIELPALAAAGIAVMTNAGIRTIPAPWAGARSRGQGVTIVTGAGGAPRSVVLPGALPNDNPAPIKTYWLPGTVRPPTMWPSDDRAADYRHLSTRVVGDHVEPGFERSPNPVFHLSGATLRFLAERNGFDLSALKRDTLLFGMRGCIIDNGAREAPWAATHRMRLATPNHIDMRCTIGVWRLSDNKLALFRASTVPEASQMYAFAPFGGYGCSLLPTGFYRYRAGTHSRKHPQPGALRIDQKYVVLRTPSDLRYDPFQPDDMWTQGECHNLHAGGSMASNPLFSSQGCQVIPGGYVTPPRQVAHGAWKGFRDACGLTGPEGFAIAEEPEKQGTFRYMLLTGLEAALVDYGKDDFLTGYRRLRHGSTGPDVRALQARLYPAFSVTEPVDGAFGMATSFAVLWEKKRTEGEYTAPIMEL